MKAEGGSHGLVLLSLLRNGSQMVENFSNELILENQSLSIFPERKLGRVISLPWISLLGNDRLQRQRSLHCSGKVRSGLGTAEDGKIGWRAPSVPAEYRCPESGEQRAEPESGSQCTFCLIAPVAQW